MTSLGKELDAKKYYPIHHPQLIQLLVELNKNDVCISLLKKLKEWLSLP